MKYLQFLFYIILISACSGTKNIVETTPKETPKIVNDSVTKNVEIIADKTSAIATKEVINTKKDSVYFIKIATHDEWTNLLKKHVTEKGNVNYKGFKAEKDKLRDYINSLSENMPTEHWMKNHKLSYWINAYNAMTVDLILRHYPIKSIKDIKNPWEQRLWKLGDKWYNLNEIEHNILRKMDEPRIHFAIVCASFSCPKLQNEAFSNINLNEQLTKVTKDFLSDSERNNITENNLELSKIFQWFSKDFKQNGDLIDFLNQYSDIKISDDAKKHFKDYNWDLNE